MERALQAELTDHLGYDEHAVEGRGTGNSRNGNGTSSGQYTALAVHSPYDVWAVGYLGAIAHYDGTAWTAITVHGVGALDLAAAFALPDGTVWIGGGADVLWRTP